VESSTVGNILWNIVLRNKDTVGKVYCGI